MELRASSRPLRVLFRAFFRAKSTRRSTAKKNSLDICMYKQVYLALYATAGA